MSKRDLSWEDIEVVRVEAEERETAREKRTREDRNKRVERSLLIYCVKGF